MEINPKASRSEKMDDNEVFVPVEDPIGGIVRIEALRAMGTTKPPDRNCNASLVAKKSGGKCSCKPRQSRPMIQENQQSRLKSAKCTSNQLRLFSKNAQRKGYSHIKLTVILLFFFTYLLTYANLLNISIGVAIE